MSDEDEFALFQDPEDQKPAAGAPRKRAPDLAWEALVRVTHANPAMERGKLNGSLTAIKDAWHSEGGLPEDLPGEIERRANSYHVMWPTMTLTPSALATHWFRVVANNARKTSQQQSLDELREEASHGESAHNL